MNECKDRVGITHKELEMLGEQDTDSRNSVECQNLTGEIQKDCETVQAHCWGKEQSNVGEFRAEETVVPSSANLKRVLDEPSGGCGKCDGVRRYSSLTTGGKEAKAQVDFPVEDMKEASVATEGGTSGHLEEEKRDGEVIEVSIAELQTLVKVEKGGGGKGLATEEEMLTRSRELVVEMAELKHEEMESENEGMEDSKNKGMDDSKNKGMDANNEGMDCSKKEGMEYSNKRTVSKNEGAEKNEGMEYRSEAMDDRDEGGVALVVKNSSSTVEGTCISEEPLKYSLSNELFLVGEARKEFSTQNYFRGCKWAPDGSCLLTCNDDNRMRVYNLPQQLYPPSSDGGGHTPGNPEPLELTPALAVVARESVYDYCWYPMMNSWEPQTCCFLSTCKDHPVHLWDAFTGQNRASYVAFNHLDEVVSSYSVAFSPDGQRVFAGCLKGLRIFDVSRPGRECRTLSTYAKKSGGQSGIISCISHCVAVPKLYALGSYSRSVGLYSEDMKKPCMVLTSLVSGVTQLVFSPCGNVLYSGFRMNGSIVGWDLRSPGRILHSMDRVVSTNQRIYYDLSSTGDFIVSGSTTGHVYGWKTDPKSTDQYSESIPRSILSRSDAEPDRLEPVLCHLVHSDAANGASIHPWLPLLATCSGQRHFSLPSDDEGGRGDEDSDSSTSDSSSLNSLRLWYYG